MSDFIPSREPEYSPSLAKLITGAEGYPPPLLLHLGSKVNTFVKSTTRSFGSEAVEDEERYEDICEKPNDGL